MPSIPAEVKTRTAHIFIDSNRILHIKMLDEVLVDELDVYDNFLVVRNLTNGQPFLRLLDARAKNWKLTEKAKEMTKKQYSPGLVIGRAVLINSKSGTTLLNFLKLMHSGTSPQKYFTSYEDAVKWLLSLRK